jgi:hypothetical protein
VETCVRPSVLLLQSRFITDVLCRYADTHFCVGIKCLVGCETWSVTLKEECRLRVFSNRVLRRIFGPKRNEVTGE